MASQWLVEESTCSVGDAGDVSSILPGARKDLLEEGMAAHASILAWRAPWTGAWQAAGLQRVRHGPKLLSTAHRALLLILGDVIMIGLGM